MRRRAIPLTISKFLLTKPEETVKKLNRVKRNKENTILRNILTFLSLTENIEIKNDNNNNEEKNTDEKHVCELGDNLRSHALTIFQPPQHHT